MSFPVSTRSTNDLITAAIWNADIKDNLNALRGGEVAISGQGARDYIYAASASALGRLALSGGQAGRVNFAASAVEAFVPDGLLDRDVAEAAVDSTTSEGTLYTYTVAGGTLASTRRIFMHAEADVLNNSGGNRQMRLRAKYGATTIFDATWTIGSSANRQPLWLLLVLSAKNATNAQVSRGELHIVQGGNADGVAVQVTGGGGMIYIGGHNTIAEDSTANKALALTMTHTNADTLCSCRTVHVWAA